MYSIQKSIMAGAFLAAAINVSAQKEEAIKYGDFEQWITRNIKESSVIGGETKAVMEIGPTATLYKTEPYHNQGGSPWATSNVYAKMMGIIKTNTSVFPDTHGNGKCARLVTKIERCKAMGMINIEVVAAGSVYTGKAIEPVTSSKNPWSKISLGVPFNKRPKALKFDYNVKLTGEQKRLKMPGLGKNSEVAGPDYALVTCLLQKRWEDEKGKLHAKRVGTIVHRFTQTTNGWKEGQVFPIQYGDITHTDGYKSYMGMFTGHMTMYALNSKGKNVPISEEGWADADETPTHIIIKFDSSHGEPFVGSPGNTFWIDNVRLVY